MGPYTVLLLALRDAALKWKSLVNHGAKFDFKAHVLLKTALDKNGCGNPCEAQSLTMCGTCFRNDVPGNLFYAYIGGFTGFSLNALQLGSQFAQLTSPGGASFDPPDDTQMIDIGFRLPKALTEAAFCAAAPSIPAKEACAACATTYAPELPK